MDLRGFEPLTPSLPAKCSNQMSYRPKVVNQSLELYQTYLTIKKDITFKPKLILSTTLI